MSVGTTKNFINKALMDVYRPYNYNVDIQFPAELAINENIGLFIFDVLAKTTSLPKITTKTKEIDYFGRKFVVPTSLENSGTWECTLRMDEENTVRDALEKWVFAMDYFMKGEYTVDDFSEYTSPLIGSVVVSQTSLSNSEGRFYKLDGLYPVDIQATTLDGGSVGTVSEYNVTFQYNYITILKGVRQKLKSKNAYSKSSDSGFFNLPPLGGLTETLGLNELGNSAISNIASGAKSEISNSLRNILK